jgi:hypothetical protein
MGRHAPEIPLSRFYLHVPEPVLIAARAAAKENASSVSQWITLAMREKLIYGRAKKA